MTQIDTAGADTSVPIGVYRTAQPDLAAVEGYESFLGMPAGTIVDFVLAFMADSPTWAQFEQAMLQSRTNGPAGTVSATAWAPLLGSRRLMLGVPACVQGTSWAQEAAGANDAHWNALAGTLIAGGLGGCVLRIGREFNAAGFPWCLTTANYTSYAAGYVHIVQVMRAAGFTGQFVWNPYLGQGSVLASLGKGVESVYPGDSVADIWGVDVYDGYASSYPAGEAIRTAAQQQAAWSGFHDSSTWDGLVGWQSWAAQRGKPLCYPEWGLQLWNSAGQYRGGGDNPVFIAEMAAWIKDTQPFMHAFWEDVGVGVSDPDDLPARRIAVPASRAAFLASFGY